MTFPGLEMTILKFHYFSRFSMTVRTLQCAIRMHLFILFVSLHRMYMLVALMDFAKMFFFSMFISGALMAYDRIHKKTLQKESVGTGLIAADLEGDRQPTNQPKYH